MPELCHPVDNEDAPFSAVLLAGGKSTRMGFDKATLVIEGEPLWRRQITLLQNLGASEVFISGPVGGPWQDSGIPVIEDQMPDRGPMGALVSILEKTKTDLVLVLAVDMPSMEAGFLRKLVGFQQAIIPQNGVYFEPLAAVYTRKNLPGLNHQLQSGDSSLQSFLCRSVQYGTTKILVLTSDETRFFVNVNYLSEVSPPLFYDYS